MTRLALALGAALTLAACSTDVPSAPSTAATDATAAAKPGGGGGGGGGETDPTAAWIIPALGEGQHVGVDARGTAYESRVCGVNAKIFATHEASGSGDAILHTNNPKFKSRGCSRVVRFSLGGASYELDAFINVSRLHEPSGGIPVGGTVQRRMALDPSGGPCSRLLFDGGTNGSAMVEVQRTAANTWIVRTAPGAATAYCEGPNVPLELPFQLTIVASRDL